jgi:hypothetical protein
MKPALSLSKGYNPPQRTHPMTADKIFIVNDQPIPKERRDFADTDALDFTPYAEIPADIDSTANTPLTSA